MDSFIGYIQEYEEPQRSIMLALHRFFGAYPELSCHFRYKILFYDRKSWICYLNPLKAGGVELCFVHGQLIADPNVLLQPKGRKQIRGLTLTSAEAIPWDDIHFFLMEAFQLEDQNINPFPRNSRKKP